ncbi:Membrane protein involved in the export of O-antigen and teichoic acid [Roseateles sp. YR242]|uniref:lipopolysaccharide biosynthesis protein n=1 Tax=Roseateles sp. YR242 TaxID=1855305 RepID=UPI0008B15952|nr:oligosaccharide flippase family protein [Roseateles sp. YR242]SEK57743.1 Membrane protein involved in the export of O-antigen and teichoic acid [Roseateles sp. YR242]
MLRATLTLLAGGALAQLLPLLLGPWITRLYSPIEFGHFSLVWTVATNVAVVGCARYEFALPLEKDSHAASRLMALCLRVLVAVTLASALIGWAWATWQDLDLALWLGLAVLAGALAQAMTLWATRASAFKALAAARLLQYGGAALLQVLMGLAAFGAVGLLLGPVIASLAAALWLATVARPVDGWRAVWQQDRTGLRAMALRHKDFPLLNTPHAFAGALQDSLALLLLSYWAGDAAAGYWALAMRYLKAPAGLVGGALSQTLYPRLVAARSPAEAVRLVRQAMAALAAFAVPLAAVLTIWGPKLFAWAFGERWQDAGELARALAPYVAVHFIASPLSVTTMAWQAQGWALRLALVGQAAFVLGIGLGLLRGGLIGAAWGVSATMALYFAYYFWALAHWKHKDGLFAT